MAADDISVSIGVQGESAFKKALTECQNSVKQLDSALKANAAEYENNADALGENVERAKLLKQAIETQKKMAEGLGDAVKYASEKYGEASSQTTKYVVAQNKAKEAVAKLEKELKDADREAEELGRDSMRVGRQLTQGIGDGAQDAAEKLDDMMEDIKSSLESIGKSTGITATIDIARGVMDGIKGITEETADYRKYMSYLEQSAKDYGQSWEEVEAHAIHVAALTGELEGAAEGVSNLMAAGLNSKETADAVNLLMGAVIKFPDTYKFESLSEALRNTIEEGKAVGQFSELLLALGVDLKTFDKAMEKAADKEQRQDIALSFGANKGLETTAAEYALANEEMLKANTATLELKGSMSELATELLDVSTAWTSLKTSASQAIVSVLKNTELDEWIVDKINNVKELADMIEIWADDEKLKEFAEGKKKERAAMIESGEAETEGEALLRQMGKPEWYINWFKEQTKKPTEEAGKETGETYLDSMTTTIEEKTTELQTAAKGAAAALTSGFSETVLPDIEGYLNGIYETLNRAPRKLPSGWNVGGGIAPQATNPMLVSLNIDGRKFASATVDYYNEAQGRQINMNV